MYVRGIQSTSDAYYLSLLKVMRCSSLYLLWFVRPLPSTPIEPVAQLCRMNRELDELLKFPDMVPVECEVYGDRCGYSETGSVQSRECLQRRDQMGAEPAKVPTIDD